MLAGSRSCSFLRSLQGAQNMLRKTDFYIDGRWVAPASPNDCEVINPADETPYAVISLGAKPDVDKAVASAVAAFETWSSVSKESLLLEQCAIG